MTNLPTPEKSSVAQGARRGWLGVVFIVLLFAAILLYVGGLWSLSIGEAVYYGGAEASNPNAQGNLREAMSVVSMGAVLILALSASGVVLSHHVGKGSRMGPRGALVLAAVIFSAEIAFFVVRPFVLGAQGVYQG